MYNVVGKNKKWNKNANQDATKRSSVTPFEKEKKNIILSGRSIAPINWLVNKQKLFENYGGGDDEGSEWGKSSVAIYTCILYMSVSDYPSLFLFIILLYTGRYYLLFIIIIIIINRRYVCLVLTIVRDIEWRV